MIFWVQLIIFILILNKHVFIIDVVVATNLDQPCVKFFSLCNEECYLNNQFSDNHNLQRKSSIGTETIAIER